MTDEFDTLTENSNNPPPPPSKEIFGQIHLTPWFCVFEKGAPRGKRPFDPQKDKIEKRRVAIDLSIIPLTESGLNFNVDRQLADSDTEWQKFTWASARDLAVTDARSLNLKYCKLAQVETGETYVKNGETKAKRAIKFLALFNTEAECVAAYQKEHGDEPQPEPAKANPSKERDTAFAFLRVIVKNAVKGKTLDEARVALQAAIAQYPVVSKHFTADSPETMQIMVEAMA